MRQQESYWAFKAPPTPEFSDLPAGTFAGTAHGFNSLSPGMRREIYRSAMKRSEALAADAERQSRADAMHRQSEVQIAGREAL